MGAIAALLVGSGIVALIVGGYLKYKGGKIAKTPLVPTGDAARGAVGADKISVEGLVECPQPLVSPVTGTPCLYYQLEVVGSWKEGDTKKTHTYVQEKHAAPFMVDDGSGGVPIDASGGGDLELQKTFDDTKKEGMFADLKGALGRGEPIMFGQYAFANPPMSKANTFQCTEKIVPMTPRAFALGKMEQGVLTGAGMFGLLLSAKSRDELLGSSAKNAKLAFIGGAAASGVGLVVGVVSTFVG